MSTGLAGAGSQAHACTLAACGRTSAASLLYRVLLTERVFGLVPQCQRTWHGICESHLQHRKKRLSLPNFVMGDFLKGPDF